MAKRILILSILAWVLFGCEDADLKISVRYDEIQGLEEGGRVIFEDNDIGRVAGVSYGRDGYCVANLVIKNDFSNAATEYARFFIIEDPKDRAKKAVEMIQTRTGGSPLETGATVQGSTRSSAILGEASGRLEQGLESLRKDFDQFAEDLKSLPKSEEWRRLEEELTRLVEEMKRSGKSAQEMIQKDLLPKLQEEIEKLRERLREFGREEEEVEPLEGQVQEIREI